MVVKKTDSAASSDKRPRVLVAEDEALIRLDLVELLTEQGYEVVGQVGDGKAAVEQARELEPDVVVLDVNMPVMDGIAAAEQIAGDRIAACVMLTAFSQRELVEKAREAGAMAYVVKPASPRSSRSTTRSPRSRSASPPARPSTRRRASSRRPSA